MTLVIKVGGHDIADNVFLTQLAQTVCQLDMPVIIVHGGGDEITQLQQALHIEPRYVDGLRITDAESLRVVTMVLAGLVNKRVVRYLLAAGVDAAGMSGVDRGLVRATQLAEYTGLAGAVRGEILTDLLDASVVPVIAPLCLGTDQSVIYNVNADHVAGAVAAAVQASRIVFITNVEGVLADGSRVERLDATTTQAWIDDGTISGGMIPKVKTALSVLDMGVPQAAITNLHGLISHGGTIFERNS